MKILGRVNLSFFFFDDLIEKGKDKEVIFTACRMSLPVGEKSCE